MSLPVALSQGTIIGGHYIVGSLLNSGGFGAVYRGIDTSEGNRSCAIKETYDVTPAARRQALMETSVLLTVRSQHLPEVYDAFEFNGRFYLIMQLIEGQNLLQLLKSRVPGGIVGEAEPYRQSSGPCSEHEVLDWLLPVMDVLQELHRRNPPIMHRDIKPGNLILTPQQTVVLVDFGLTRLYDPAHSTQTIGRAVSVGFSPLEQYMGKTSPQSDIYSMAATMYLLLTNRLPSAALSRSMNDDLIAPRLLNPLISPTVERALVHALAIHADQRYSHMSDFAQALRAPVFTAHGDKTDVVAPAIAQAASAQSVPTIVASRPTLPATNPALPIASPYAYRGVQAVPTPAPASKQQNAPRNKKGVHPAQQAKQSSQPHQAQVYPVLPPGGSASGYGMPPQAQSMARPYQTARRLPSSFNQGCLWGLLEGIGAGLIVWFLKQEMAFYLALLIGLASYLAAGFFTTRRGGNFLRGAKAGYWAGVTSVLLFGTTLGIFLIIAFSQQLRVLTAGSNLLPQNIGAATQSAWSAVQPMWPGIILLPDQPPLINFVALLLMLVFVAWLLGLVGGILGSLKNTADVTNRQQQIPHP